MVLLSIYTPGARVRVGRADAQVRGGAGAHVVAEHARPGLAIPVSTSDPTPLHSTPVFAFFAFLLPHDSVGIWFRVPETGEQSVAFIKFLDGRLGWLVCPPVVVTFHMPPSYLFSQFSRGN